jgi:hypothetical protein
MMLIFFLLSYTIVDVDVDAKWTDRQLVIQSSGLLPGETLEDNSITEAISNLAKLRLFNFIAIDTSLVGDGIFIRVVVEEAPFL